MSETPRITRRTLLALVAAAPLAVVPFAPADPVAAAYGELVGLAIASEREHDRLGDIGAGALVLVRGMAALLRRLEAELGPEAGGAAWTAAVDRHYAWMGRRYGLVDAPEPTP